jgi:hypothetical protein
MNSREALRKNSTFMAMKITGIIGILALVVSVASPALKAQQPSSTIPFQYNNGTFDTVHVFFGNDPKLSPPIQLFYSHLKLGLPLKTWGPGTGGFNATYLKLKPDLTFHFVDLDLGQSLTKDYVRNQWGFTYEYHLPWTIQSRKRSGPLEVVATVGGPKGAIFSGEAVRMPFTSQVVIARYAGLKRETVLMQNSQVYHAAIIGMSWSQYSTASTFQVSAAKTVRSAEIIRHKIALKMPLYRYGSGMPDAGSITSFLGATFESSYHSTSAIVNPFSSALRRIEQQGFMCIGMTMHPFLINNRPVFTIDFGGGGKIWSIGLHRFGRETVRLGEAYYRKKVQVLDSPF